MTLHLVDASPSVAAYGCEPLSTAEIDAHPDSGRIWATIVALRDEMAADAEDDQARELSLAESCARDAAISDCASEIANALRNMSGSSGVAVIAEIKSVVEAW